MENISIYGFLNFLKEKKVIDEDSIVFAKMFVSDYLKSVNSGSSETQAVRQNEQLQEVCNHNYEYYTNELNETVAVCSKCTDAYF